MKRITAWILVLLMLVQSGIGFSVPAEEETAESYSAAGEQREPESDVGEQGMPQADGEEPDAGLPDGEKQAENALGSIAVPAPKHQYHTVTFTADGEEVATLFVSDGARIETLPAAPEAAGAAFLGWFDGNIPFSAEETILADRRIRAVYRKVRPDLEEKKRKANFRYEDAGQYVTIEIFGTTKKNQVPGASRKENISGDRMISDAWTVTGIKNNANITVEAVVTALPAAGTLSALPVRNSELLEPVAENLQIGDTVVIDLAMKGPNGIAFAVEAKNEEAPEEENGEIEGALYANEDLYITGKIPGKGIIDVLPVEVEIEGEKVIAAYDISIYVNAQQKKKGRTWQPADRKVQVHLRNDRFSEGEYGVYHLADGNAEPEYLETVKAEEGWIAFDAESFSVYAITEVRLNQTVTTSDGATYDVQVTYRNTAGIPMEGTALLVTELLPGDEGYDGYVAASADRLGAKTENMVFSRVFDIKIVSENDPSVIYEPLEEVEVSITLVDSTLDSYANVDVLHFVTEESFSAETFEADSYSVYEMQSAVSGETVEFATDSFSVFVVAGYKLEKEVVAGNGRTYRITVTFTEDAELPEGVDLSVSELTDEIFESYVNRAAELLGAEDIGFARVFDISLVDAGGEKLQPAAAVEVKVELLDAGSPENGFAVVHFAPVQSEEGEKTEQPELLASETEGNTVFFESEGFSAYAIVEGPEPVPVPEMEWVETLADLAANCSGPNGFYLCYGYRTSKGPQFFTAELNAKGAFVETADVSRAAVWFFEAGADPDSYNICTLLNGEKKYMDNAAGSRMEMKLSTDAPAPALFVLSDTPDDWKFYFKKATESKWLQHSNGGGGIRFYSTNTSDASNPRISIACVPVQQFEDDPYDLDGKSYGLMNWNEGVYGKAVMAEPAGENALAAKELVVMTQRVNGSGKLFVPNADDIALWKFEWDHDDFYCISKGGQYIRIAQEGVSLSSERSSVRVVPGAGANAGTICLKSGDHVLTYSGRLESGFGIGGSVGNEWLYLVEESGLTEEYFMPYSASKVSVTDIHNAAPVIVYTRSWNEKTLKYDFYVVNYDGSLVPAYENGSQIEWVGGRVNTFLWNFVEYYWEGTDDPNYYYDLFNPYNETYIAPQMPDQVLRSSPIGINLTGRQDGYYQSSILAWDEGAFSYTGLRVDEENRRIVPCSTSEAMDFYFAEVYHYPVDDRLDTVATVDHEQHGVTMKIVDIETGTWMDGVLGSSAGGLNAPPTQNLLSTGLGSNGYPDITKGGSLSAIYSGAFPVNNLFIASTYSSSGYFEFDSSQNFASLHGSDFTVYKQIGTYDSAGGRPTLKHGQFFPFNDLKPGIFASTNRKNLYDAEQNELANENPRKNELLYNLEHDGQKVNPYFALEIEAGFSQTPDGRDNWGHDIIYEFTGDDDFWLYVDGELVIDLGGKHSALAGSVNFRTGQVSVNGRRTTLRQCFESNYKKRNPGAGNAEVAGYLSEYFEEGETVFRDYSSHTMRIFYMERGAGASNLHMRFNLASVKQGTVELSKELEGIDSSVSVLAEFPYQIWYTRKPEAGGKGQNPDGQQAETRLVPSAELHTSVRYRNSVKDVPYNEVFTIPNTGLTYQDVFMLRPGETAVIRLPENTTGYRIVECGVNTEVYGSVRVNGTALTGTESGVSGRRDFGTDRASIGKRPRVNFVNAVNPEALKTLTIRKELYKEDGETELSYQDDQSTFTFRLYLESEFAGDLDYAGMYTYRIMDPGGHYCRWDEARRVFVPTAWSENSGLTDAQKETITFRTSIYGTISGVPAFHSVEVPNILAGTAYRVEERKWEIPDGYSFAGYEYDRVNAREEKRAGTAGVTGTAVVSADPEVVVRNVKGYGLRINKVWSDADYMTDRDAACFAVYTRTGDELTLVPDDTEIMDENGNPVKPVRQLKLRNAGGAVMNQTLYWYFPHLLGNASSLNQYVIREVTVENPVVDDDGNVTDFDAVTPVEENGTLTLHGIQKGERARGSFTYTVRYVTGNVAEGSQVRIDTAGNSRPGILLRKTDWAGAPLAGAVFELRDSENALIGTFTSDRNGMITTALLSDDGAQYTLTEIKSPQGYRAVPDVISLSQTGGLVTVAGIDQENYTLTQGAGIGTELVIRNRPFTLTARKVNGDQAQAPLKDAEFALHRQVTVGQVTMFDVTPMEGYGSLVTGSDGIIPKVDGTLPAGTYELREINPPKGFSALGEHIYFTIDATGNISLGNHPDGVTLTDEVQEDGSAAYTLLVENRAGGMLTVTKLVAGDMGDRMADFIFTLKSVEGEPEGTEYEWIREAEGAVVTGKITTGPENNTFSLKHGESIQLKLPSNRAVQITEANGAYTTEWTAGEGPVTLSGSDTADVTITLAGSAEVTVTNTLNAVSPTGVRSVWRPFCLMLAAGLILLALAVHNGLRRRKETGLRME